eukprot:2445023-Rhodomonas_salina.1
MRSGRCWQRAERQQSPSVSRNPRPCVTSTLKPPPAKSPAAARCTPHDRQGASRARGRGRVFLLSRRGG